MSSQTQPNVDPGAVMAVNSARALTDPIIVHEPGQRWADSIGDEKYQHAKMARLARNMRDDTPLEEPFTQATWPETVIFMFTMSHDERFASDSTFVDCYAWANRKYLDRWVDGVEPTEAPEPICSATAPTGYQRKWLTALRQRIKQSQDEHYLDRREQARVPATFWTQYHGQTPLHAAHPHDDDDSGNDDLLEALEPTNKDTPDLSEL